MLKKIFIGIIALSWQLGFAQEDYTLMFYNLLDFPEAPPSNRISILNEILDEVNPDIFMVCELQTDVAATLILDEALNEEGTLDYAMPAFVYNTSSTGQDLQQHLYFNQNKFSLYSTDIIQTSLRDINYYRLEVLNNEEDQPLYLDVFIAHLKASIGADNALIRSQMVNDFTTYLANLPDDAHVIFAGDFNFYTANESGFLQLLMGQSNILFSDPIDAIGDWNNNPNFSYVHTQSTRTSNNNFSDFGAGGGLDDRFDFMLVSSSFMNPSSAISYKPNTYQAYGNNGNCYNKNISDTSCFGNFSQSTRNLLYNMSDHLPVVMKITNNQATLSAQAWDTSTEILSMTSGTWVENTLNLEIKNSLIKSYQLMIFNSLGKKMWSIESHMPQQSIDVSNFSSGVYFVKIKGFPQTFRFVKQ